MSPRQRAGAELRQLEIRRDQARQADVIDRDRIRRAERDHDVRPDLRHRARERREAAEHAQGNLDRVVGRTGSGGEIVDRRVAETAAEVEEIAARGRDRAGDLARAGVEGVRRAQRHVAVDGARVGQGVAGCKRHVAIDLPLIAQDVAAGESDIAVDLAEVVERVSRPAEEVDRADDLTAVGQGSDRPDAVDRECSGAAVLDRPGVVQVVIVPVFNNPLPPGPPGAPVPPFPP